MVWVYQGGSRHDHFFSGINSGDNPVPLAAVIGSSLCTHEVATFDESVDSIWFDSQVELSFELLGSPSDSIGYGKGNGAKVRPRFPLQRLKIQTCTTPSQVQCG
jgi:hypothetical protein